MAKILCMEIGTSTVRLAEVKKTGKKVEVLNTHVFDTPDDAMKDGKVRVSDKVVAAIRQGIDESGITATDVYFVVESTKILFKQVEIPFVAKNKIQQTLELSFTDYFPVDELLYHIAYVLEKSYEKNGIKMLGLDVFAIPNDLSESYYNLAVALGLNARGLTDTSRSMTSLFPSTFKNRNVAMVNLNESTSTLTISIDGDMVFNKTIPYGVGPAIQQVRNSPLTMDDPDVTDAIGWLYANNIILRQIPVAISNPDDENEKLRYNVTTSVVSLIKSIETTFTTFLAKENITIHEFTISGLGAGFAGISQLLASEFGIPVKVIQEGDNLKINAAAASDTLLLSCYPCVGASVDKANFFTAAERAGGELARKKKIDKYFIIGGALICVSVFAYSAYSWLDINNALLKVKTEHKRLTTNVQQLIDLGVEVAHIDYTTAQSYNQQVKVLYEETKSGNEEMTIFLEELESILPKTARVSAMSLTPTTSSVSFLCQDKFVAAGVLHKLRNMETIYTMECPGVAELANTGEISFQCQFTLKGEIDRMENVLRDEEGNIILDEFGNPMIDETYEETPDEEVEQPTEPEVQELLAYSTKQNTSIQLDIFTHNGYTTAMDGLTTAALEQNGFTETTQQFFIANEAIEVGGIVCKTAQNDDLRIAESDGFVEFISTTDTMISFVNGIKVGDSMEDVIAALGDNAVEMQGGRYMILKSDTHTLIIATDLVGANVVESISLISNNYLESIKPTETIMPEAQNPVDPEAQNPVDETVPTETVPTETVDGEPTSETEGGETE